VRFGIIALNIIAADNAAFVKLLLSFSRFSDIEDIIPPRARIFTNDRVRYA